MRMPLAEHQSHKVTMAIEKRQREIGVDARLRKSQSLVLLHSFSFLRFLCRNSRHFLHFQSPRPLLPSLCVVPKEKKRERL
jgi:hypothetical protein